MQVVSYLSLYLKGEEQHLRHARNSFSKYLFKELTREGKKKISGADNISAAQTLAIRGRRRTWASAQARWEGGRRSGGGGGSGGAGLGCGQGK